MATWVFAEAESPGGPLTRATRELLTGAGGGEAGHEAGDDIVAFGVAEQVAGAATELGRFGATRVVAVRGCAGRLVAGPLVATVAAAAVADPASACDLILLPTSHNGREVAGRLAARLGRPVIANGTAMSGGPTGGVIVETTILGGSTVVHTAFGGPKPWLASFKVGAFEQAERANPTLPDIEFLDPPVPAVAAAPVVLGSHHPGRGDGPSLDEATVVVAGGRGLGSAEAFARLGELAELLGGAVGATRAAVDAGWVDHTAQVGQTGRTVTPALYLAFGLSGAAQHLVGMHGSRHVVAVNRDRAAPIVGLADLTVVGDAKAVLDRVIQALRDRAERG